MPKKDQTKKRRKEEDADAASETGHSIKSGSVQSPDRRALDERIRQHKEKMDAWKAEKEALNAEISKLEAQRKAKIQSVEEVRRSLHGVISEQKVLTREKERIRAERDGHRARVRELRDIRRGGGQGARSVEDIDRRMEQLEYKHSTESMPVAMERELMKEMSSLRVARREIASQEASRAAAAKELEAVEAKEEESNAALTRVMEELRSRHTVFDGANKAVRGADGEVKKVDGALRAARDKRSAVIKAMSAEYAELKEYRQQYDREVAQFREAMKDVFRKRDEERKLREAKVQQERQAEEDRRQAAIDAEEEARLPWQENVVACHQLLSRLRAAAPTKVADYEAAHPDLVAKHTPVSSDTAKPAPSAETPALEKREERAVPTLEEMKTDDGKSLRLISRKKKDDDGMMNLSSMGKKSKKSSKKAKKTKKSAPAPSGKLPIDMAIISLFSQADVPLPANLDDLEATLDKVYERLDYYATTPDPRKIEAAKRKQARLERAEIAKKLHKGDRVHSVYGHGYVIAVRPDSIVHVKMTSFTAHAFVRAQDLQKL